MALQTFVKISNISSLSDARYCAGMGVDILGFNIDPSSPECVSETDFKEITDWVAGVAFAGEFHSASLEEIKASLKNHHVDYIQLSNIDLIEHVRLMGKSIIFVIKIGDASEIEGLKSKLSYLDELAEIVILKSDNPELTITLDEYIAFHNGNVKLLKGYAISPVGEMAKFPGLELEATKEEKPGFKDYGDIMDVLEVIEEL